MSPRKHIVELLGVWGALLALLATTAAVGWLPWKSLHPTLNFGIAIVKALLIAVFFMHLRRASTLARLLAAAGFFWLAILVGLSSTDFWTRAVTPLQ